MKWYYPENWEKYLLILMSAVGYFAYAALMIIAYLTGNGLFKFIAGLFFMLACLAITGMIIRKGMKYKISKSGLEFGYSTPEKTESEPENLRGE